MSNKTHKFKYTILTKTGMIITDTMESSKMSTAKKRLKFKYPYCCIHELKSTSVHHYLNSNSPASGLIL